MKLPDSIRTLVDALAELPSIGPRQAIRLVFYLINRGPNNIQNLSRSIDELKKIKLCERCFFIHQNPDALCDICRNPSRRQDIIMFIEKETDLLSVENTGKFSGRYFILGAISKTGLLEDWQKLRLQSIKNFIEKNLGDTAHSIHTSDMSNTSDTAYSSNTSDSTHISDTSDTTYPSDTPDTSNATHSPGAAAGTAGQALRLGSGQAEEIILGFNPTSSGDFNASLIEKELKPFAKKITRLGRGLPTGGEIEFADDETLGAAFEQRR